MTAMEKAAQLIVDYQLTIRSLDYLQACQCSIMTVDEIIDAIDWHEYEVPNDQLKFWFEVKSAIENMQGGEQ